MKLFNYIVPTKQEKGLKALVISDIHYYSSKDNYKLGNIIKELNTNHYDVLYLVGDIIDSTNMFNDVEAVNYLIKFIKIISNKLPIYLTYASHDLAYFNYGDKEHPWTKDEETFRDKFLDVVRKFPNVYVKENTIYDLPNGDTVSIINPSLDYAMDTPDGNKEELLSNRRLRYSFLNNLDYNKTNTLLCHYPQAIFSLHKYGLLKGVNLSIAGHNHNGITQLRVFPLEGLLNFFGQENRGLITPAKKISLENTKYLRGLIELDQDSSLIINPSITSLGSTTGILNKADKLFYQGASVINYVREEELESKKHR